MLEQLKNIVGVLAIAAAGSIHAQTLKVPAPSPLQTTRQAFALSDVTIEYSRPSMKGRTVFGDLVPYDKVWRTGANAATKIMISDDVKIEGVAVPSGTYAIYTIPKKDSWDIMLYKDLSLGGNVADYKKENEVAKFTVKTQNISDKTETFTIDFADLSSTSMNMRFTWENTRVVLNITADIDAKVMKNIESAVVNDNRPYFQAAGYYYENNKDLNKAMEWIDKAISMNPKAYYMFMLKAKIQAKQGNKKDALATANQVIALAKEGKNDDYVKQAEKFIADNK